MAEGAGGTGGPRLPQLQDRRILYIAAVVIVFLFMFILITVRTCGTRTAGDKYIVIYSNLELRDAANVISRLKEMRIPYEIREEGKSIAVMRDKADQARIGLAEEGLPAGGAVGWEIFDETRLGATDFDRRIQFIRAISGELARTIRQINAVDDARVQIVIPETRLFEAAKAPVTASVLLKLKPGKSLTPSQVRGIIHLVASSVENLQTENVTLVDIYGNILTEKAVALPPVIPSDIIVEEKVEETKKAEEVKKAEETRIKEYDYLGKRTKELEQKEKSLQKREKELESKLAEIELAKIAKPKPLTQEEKALLRLKLKRELEADLAAKAQSLLNKFYPPNTVLVKVNIETGKPKVEYVPEEATLEKMTAKEITLKAKEVISINRITSVVLVDNRVELTNMIKKDTYKSVAGAIGYSRARGDTITLRKVPFHYAVAPPEEFKPKLREAKPGNLRERFAGIVSSIRQLFTRDGASSAILAQLRRIGRGSLIKVVVITFAILFGIYILRRTFKKRKKGPKVGKMPKEEAPDYEKGMARVKKGLEDLVESQPEKLAHLLENWLAEEA